MIEVYGKMNPEIEFKYHRTTSPQSLIDVNKTQTIEFQNIK